MKRSSIIGALVCMFFCVGLAFAEGEQAANSTPSLGELARELKAQREKEHQKPAKVYTNDDLPGGVSRGGLAVAGGISESPPGGKGGGNGRGGLGRGGRPRRTQDKRGRC